MGIKKIIRIIFKSREKESFSDTVDRHLTKLRKIIYRKTYSIEELKNYLIEIGLNKGDTVMIHASWRAFYNFQGSPQNVITLIESLVGDSGTIAMPCYGSDRNYLDVKNTPSAAGYLSEIFRKMDGVKRSHCTHFSVAVKGPKADYLIEEHELSKYGFDNHSPCYKLTTIPNSKILFLGLGDVPTKISIFHCAGAVLYDTDPKIKALLSNHYKAILVEEDGTKREKDMVIRLPGHGNNKTVFKQIFKSIDKRCAKKLSNLDIVLIDAKEAYENALSFSREGKYCYKNMKNL